jgi:phage-related protein
VRQATTGGQALPLPLRRRFEAATGRDLRAVRTRSDAAAGATATALGARAYTLGGQIVFAPGLYLPETAEGQRLLAHEIGHVVQAGAAPPLLSDPPALPASATGEVVRRAPEDAAPVPAAGGGGIVGSVIDTALGLLPDAFARTVRRIRAEGGILPYLRAIIGDGLRAAFGALSDLSPAIAGAITAIEGIGSRLGAILGALASGDCGPLFGAIEQLKTTVSEAAGAAWDRVTEFLRPVGDFFSSIWARFGAPAVSRLSELAGEAGAWLEQLGRDLWDLTGPVRDYAGFLWTELKRFIGIGPEDDTEGSGNERQGIIGWLTARANDAWTAIKRLAEPVTRPLGALVDQIAAALPLRAISDLRTTITDWLSQTASSVESLNEPATTGSAEGQGRLRDVILPALANVIGVLRGGVGAARDWVASAIGGLAGQVTGLLDAIAGNSLFAALGNALGWLRAAAGRVVAFATNAVTAAFGLIDQGLDLLGSFARRIIDSFLEVASTVADIPGRFANLVLGPLWRAIPACIRDPVVDFLTNQILRRIPVFSQLLQLPDFWDRCVATAMQIIRDIFVDGNIGRGLYRFFSAMLSLIGLPPDLVTGIIARAARAIGDILRDPIGFLLNLLSALKQGFGRFFDNALTHLLGGISGWLFAQAERAGLRPPASLSFGEVFRFILDVLGLGLEFIFARIERISPAAAGLLRRGAAFAGEALQWLTDVITEGPAALWRHLTEQLSNLWETVIGAVTGWVSNTIMAQMVPRLLSMLDPTGIGAVVNSLIALYRAIESAIEYLRPMLEIVRSVLDGVGEIARGALEGAATLVEGTLARAVPIIVGFLANQLGLGSLGRRIGETVEAIRERLAAAVDWLLERGRALLLRLTGRGARDVAEGAPAAGGGVRAQAAAALQQRLHGDQEHAAIERVLADVLSTLRPQGLQALVLGPEDEDGRSAVLAEASPRLPLFALIPRGLIPRGRTARMVARMHLHAPVATALQPVPAVEPVGRAMTSTVLGTGRFGAARVPGLDTKTDIVSAWNTASLTTNNSRTHAESQFVSDLERRGAGYLGLVDSLDIAINLSPCTSCRDELLGLTQAIITARSALLGQPGHSGRPPLQLTLHYERLFVSRAYPNLSTNEQVISDLTGRGWRIFAPPDQQPDKRNAYLQYHIEPPSSAPT